MRKLKGMILAITILVSCHEASGRDDPDGSIPYQKMAVRVDSLIEQRLQQIGWAAADECSDSAFIRRAYLDFTGTAPKAFEVAEFLQDSADNKRPALLAKLVKSPTHAEHLAAIWSSWLTPQRDDVPSLGRESNGLQTWLRNRFSENLRYDRLVADLLVSTGPVTSGPTSFFVSLESKPEKIATQTARVFMGVQLDCAQCHDHPFDHWKQKDFWGFAAYFAQISSNGRMEVPTSEVRDAVTGEVMLPNSEEVVAPKPLVETDRIQSRGTRRQQLTLWLTTPDNPYLARATVNRVWALLMGRGLVEPVDDMRAEHIASHPELLEELSEFFVATRYDLRQLILAIASTRAYGRSTRHLSGSPPEESYACMLTKPLTERQLANCVTEVARQMGEQGQSTQQLLERQLGRLRGEASQSKLGIVNALVTLHGDLVNQTSSEQSSRLVKALQAPHLDTHSQIRWMFLAVLARYPNQQEEQFLSEHFLANSQTVSDLDEPKKSDSTANSSASCHSDLLWALLNSSEFAMTP